MVAVRIGPDIRLIIVGSPDYLERHGIPETPQDLSTHRAVNLRLLAANTIYAWELEKDGHEVRIKLDGSLVFDSPKMVLRAALEGFGLAIVNDDEAAPYLQQKVLRQVLSDWTPPFTGYYLYYPSRRQHSAAFTLFLDELRKSARKCNIVE